MKKKGIVKEISNGHCIIVDASHIEYIGLDEHIPEGLKVKDAVTFEGELKEKGDIKMYRAYFIKKINK